MSQPYPVIKNYDLITCAGESLKPLWEGALNKKTYIDSDGFGRLPSRPASGNPKEALSALVLKHLKPSELRDCGLVLATTTGCTSTWESDLMDYLSGKRDVCSASFSREPLGFLLQGVQEDVGAQGPSTLITTACAASTHALGLAQIWLQTGRVSRCLVVATELLCLLTDQGFESFNLLSQSPCRPFDKNRDGINLSEAMGFIYLEAEDVLHPEDIFISGFGASTDTHQMTSPDPQGTGCQKSILGALKRAGLNPQDVDYIHCHGTASIQNDLAEASALKAVWPDEAPLFSSTKGSHGHALGASGLIESCLIFEMMKKSLALPTCGFTELDPLVERSPLQDTKEVSLKHVLKNTLGFGGANASLLFSQGGL